jgi:ATP-binding cassette subfamily F protein 3
VSLLTLQNIQVSFGGDDILLGISGDIEKGDRIGLVGRNGAGKTTLLHVLSGDLRPSQGQRHIARDISVGIVEQVATQETSSRTVYAEGLTAVAGLLDLEMQVEDAAHALSDGGEAAATRYAELQHEFEHRGGYLYRSRLAQVLNGLGLPESQWHQQVSELSGGQRTRLALAKALLSASDLLILDEPTNHIDVEAMKWLDEFLTRWPGTLVVTSHDRYFLDRVVNRVWSIENGRMRSYRGNYSQFVRQREADRELLQKQAAAQAEMIAKEEAFIRRYGAGQRAKEAQGRQKRLDRVERIVVQKDQRSTTFKLKAQRSGEVVLTTKDLEVGYTDTLLYAGSLEVERGQRVALLGANGSGKTTLLKTIARELDARAGSLRLGSNVSLAHYWQEAENLDAGATVYEEMRRDRVMDPQEVRNILGAFLFSGTDVDKQVSALSGGERSRLALAKLMLENANLLLLDEPTNHLDIPARESLEDALSEYPGSILFVSHDRRLIADLATVLWVVEDGRLKVFEGSFEEYLERPAAKEAAPVVSKQAPPPPPKASSAAPKLTYKQQAAITKIETDIEAKETALAELVEQIHDASSRGDARALADLGQQHDDLKAEIDALMDEWAVLTG